MDFGGSWRLLHYTMKKVYAPFVIVASSRDDSCEIWAVSDINEPVTGTCTITAEPRLDACSYAVHSCIAWHMEQCRRP